MLFTGVEYFRDNLWVGLWFRGRDMIRNTFSDKNVVPRLTKYADLGTHLTW